MLCFLKPIAKYIFDNFYWIVPTIATLIMIYYVKITSKEQIESAANDTVKQIRSQIKEQYRPFLEYINIKRLSKTDGDIFEVNFNEADMNSPTEVTPNYLRIEIKNIGRGIATNIRIFRIMDEGRELEYTKNGNMLPINCDTSSSYKLSIMLRPFNNEKLLDFLIFFQDLHGNVYSSLLMISLKKEVYPEYVVIRDDLVNYETKLSKEGINYPEIQKKYNSSYRKSPTG